MIGFTDALGLVWDVTVSGDYAYVLAGLKASLHIVDITNAGIATGCRLVWVDRAGPGDTVWSICLCR